MKTNSLSVTSFANIFSQSVGCLFILFIVSFDEQTLLSLSRSHLFIFAFFFNYSGKWIEKETAAIYVQSVLPMFSSRSFIVSGLTFRPLIHFYPIFVYGIKEWSNFTFLCVAVYFSQQHLLKRLSFQHCIVLPPLS